MDIGMDYAAYRSADEWNHSREMDGKKIPDWMDGFESQQTDEWTDEYARMGKDP